MAIFYMGWIMVFYHLLADMAKEIILLIELTTHSAVELATSRASVQTKQSDVYRFGVVLHFMESISGDVLVRILDSRLEACGEVEVLMLVGKLVEKCLVCSSMDRPTMKRFCVRRYMFEFQSAGGGYAHR
ncbi:wall-associated kinase family protein [Striga asiatica]|uniref:Wall-associated kinase family protein n=1 Tax=Striga asiatica TaxID=4170 RepID=A0A5A7PFN0_STRAF|nr:wall-associated kinase family protein [Striga asiatica]